MAPEALVFNCIMSSVGHGKRWHRWHKCHIIIKWPQECSFHVIRPPSPTLLWGVIIWYNEITLGVLPSCWKMTPTHHAIRSHRYRMHVFVKPLRGWRRGNLPWCNTYFRLCPLQYNIYIWVMKAELHCNIMKCLCQCFIPVIQWPPYTHKESHFMT